MNKLLIALAVLTITVGIQGCSKVVPSSVSLGVSSTDIGNSNKITEAEYANTFKVDTRRADVKVNFNRLHLAYRHENIRSGGVDEIPSLINTDHNWMGVGVNTPLGGSVTYYQDLSHKLWMVDLEGKYKIKHKLSVVIGAFHLDKDGGSLFKSGGRRTTGLRGGMSYEIIKNLNLDIFYEVLNNGASTIQDGVMTGISYLIPIKGR